MTLITNGANSGHWLRRQAKCLALAFVLAILGTVPGHGAEAARPGITDRCLGTDCAQPPTRGVTVYRGLVLDYEVIDGMAVHDGDMVLGTAAEAAAAAPSREPAGGEPAKRESIAGLARRDIIAVSDIWLWPGGRVPYEIDERIEGEDLEVIHAALEEWNSKTVIEFFPRADEEFYALIEPRGEGNCRSAVGRIRPTRVSTGGCWLGATIHELGHAVGLYHEHQRYDRDRALVAPPERGRRSKSGWGISSATRFIGPYDYRSIMRYGPFDGVISIPPGIQHAGVRLSEGDIDGVARLYGEPPGTVTVATNPPGLQLIVDGDSVTAPATFDWPPGSVHTLEAPLVHDRGSRPHVFGRWNDGGERQRTVTVDTAGTTWFEANYIQLTRVRVAVSPPDAGTFALAPESPDGWYPMDSPVDATPIPAGGRREFARYRLGNSADEVRLVGEQQARITPRRDVTIEALYRTPPLYRINSNAEGLQFRLNPGLSLWRTPSAFQPSELPAGATVSVPEFPEYFDGRAETDASGGRYRFVGWGDAGEREHEFEVPAGGGSLTMQIQREFQLVAYTSLYRADSASTIDISPELEDGYHTSGSQVQLTAVPAAGEYFVGWEQDLAGTETTRSVIMDRDRLAVALFSATEPVLVPFGEPVPTDFRTGRHFVRVPDGTSAVAIRFESSTAVGDAEFLVIDGVGSREYGSTRLRESDTITLTRETLSRMRHSGRFHPTFFSSHHLLIRPRGGSALSGTLHATIQRDWIAGVWPPAFTFVSAAGWSRPLRQTLRVTPVEGEIPPVRYRIVSDSHWLEAFPPEWTGAQGEAEIAVTANGAALGAEAYGGKLKIHVLRDGDAAEGWTPTGIEIPVHFVVKPADGAGEPTGDGSSGLAGGDDHGDTREAATELAAGAAARGRLERVGDEDWFRFRTTAALTRVTAYTESEGDTTGELHVAGRDSPLADDDSGSGANFRIAASVPAGTHYLRVRGFGTADYALTLEAVPDDHGDTRELSTEIAVGGSTRGRIDVAGDEDWFRFRTTAARTWVTARAESDGDTTGELHVAGSDTPADVGAGSGGNYRIAASVPAGTHYLRVSGRGIADFTVTLQETLDAMEFARIPAGRFVMGGNYEGPRGNYEGPHREVQISQGFWIGKYEVTQSEWEALMGENPSRHKVCGQTCPVESVSWEDLQEFIRRLNEREAGSEYAYRLPTEAEWEYAARAGTTWPRHGELDDVGWWHGNSRGANSVGQTRPVGQKRANPWGLHDMLGNVEEWTADWYGEYPTASWVTDPQGPSTGSRRVHRGGAVAFSAERLMFAKRSASTPDRRYWALGFRLVRTQAGGSSGVTAEDDHGDAREAATEIAVGDSAHGRIGRLGDEDWFRFRTTAARTWVTAHAVSEGVTAVEVHAAGAPPADGDSGGGGEALSPRSTAAVPAGTHFLRVLGLGTLDYTLALRETLDAMEFARIPAGSFVMGSPEDEEGRFDGWEGPQREVTLSQAFWMGKHEVTQVEWEALMGSNPSRFSECGAQCPVENVSWEDAQEFIRRLNERESESGYVFRLPTEAEWEYAARAGTTGPRHGELDDVAWWRGNSGRRTHPVGQKRANAWGLHDMLGNVGEWTADLHGDYPSGAATDPTGPSTGSERVIRGADYSAHARYVRSAFRTNSLPGRRFVTTGFRLVRTD